MKHLIFIPFLLLIFPIFIFAQPKDDNCNECEKQYVVNWLKKHENQLESTNLKEMLLIPVQYQSPIFTKLPAKTKVSIWTEKIDQELSKTWTYAQRELILEAKSYINLELYLKSPISETKAKELKEFAQKLSDVFSREEIIDVFTSLKAISNPQKRNCNCSTNDDWCPGPFGSCSSGECKNTSWGCGFFWAYSCDGKCRLHIRGKIDLIRKSDK